MNQNGILWIPRTAEEKQDDHDYFRIMAEHDARKSLGQFITQSWAIEGESIPQSELLAVTIHYEGALQKKRWTASTLTRFLQKCHPGQELRDRIQCPPGEKPQDGIHMKRANVVVGAHTPPPGGPGIRKQLNRLLKTMAEPPDEAETGESARRRAWRHHVEFETLHPFTDGNGRMGRMLWLWEMLHLGFPRSLRFLPPLLFLHEAYYAALDGQRKENR